LTFELTATDKGSSIAKLLVWRVFESQRNKDTCLLKHRCRIFHLANWQQRVAPSIQHTQTCTVATSCSS